MIQSTIKTEESKPVNEWPKLMYSRVDPIVVFFIDEKSGFVVNSNSDIYPIGFFCGNWSLDVFDNLDGEITLRNE